MPCSKTWTPRKERPRQPQLKLIAVGTCWAIGSTIEKPCIILAYLGLEATYQAFTDPSGGLSGAERWKGACLNVRETFKDTTPSGARFIFGGAEMDQSENDQQFGVMPWKGTITLSRLFWTPVTPPTGFCLMSSVSSRWFFLLNELNSLILVHLPKKELACTKPGCQIKIDCLTSHSGSERRILSALLACMCAFSTPNLKTCYQIYVHLLWM